MRLGRFAMSNGQANRMPSPTEQQKVLVGWIGSTMIVTLCRGHVARSSNMLRDANSNRKLLSIST